MPCVGAHLSCICWWPDIAWHFQAVTVRIILTVNNPICILVAFFFLFRISILISRRFTTSAERAIYLLLVSGTAPDDRPSTIKDSSIITSPNHVVTRLIGETISESGPLNVVKLFASSSVAWLWLWYFSSFSNDTLPTVLFDLPVQRDGSLSAPMGHVRSKTLDATAHAIARELWACSCLSLELARSHFGFALFSFLLHLRFPLLGKRFRS